LANFLSQHQPKNGTSLLFIIHFMMTSASAMAMKHETKPIDTYRYKNDNGVSAAPSSAPIKKRKKKDANESDVLTRGKPQAKFAKTEIAPSVTIAQSKTPPGKRQSNARPKELRLSQNRKAASESRRRKKEMIEELQRCVVFFSRTNVTLTQQNSDMERLLLEAQTEVGRLGGKQEATQVDAEPAAAEDEAQQDTEATSQGQAVAGLPPVEMPAMETGSTMQAMASFQQAAAAAMQQAARGLINVFASPLEGSNNATAL
jgi:hypothetical protein